MRLPRWSDPIDAQTGQGCTDKLLQKTSMQKARPNEEQCLLVMHDNDPWCTTMTNEMAGKKWPRSGTSQQFTVISSATQQEKPGTEFWQLLQIAWRGPKLKQAWKPIIAWCQRMQRCFSASVTFKKADFNLAKELVRSKSAPVSDCSCISAANNRRLINILLFGMTSMQNLTEHINHMLKLMLMSICLSCWLLILKALKKFWLVEWWTQNCQKKVISFCSGRHQINFFVDNVLKITAVSCRAWEHKKDGSFCKNAKMRNRKRGTECECGFVIGTRTTSYPLHHVFSPLRSYDTHQSWETISMTTVDAKARNFFWLRSQQETNARATSPITIAASL